MKTNRETPGKYCDYCADRPIDKDCPYCDRGIPGPNSTKIEVLCENCKKYTHLSKKDLEWIVANGKKFLSHEKRD